jgi:hypothetical protein
VRLVVARDQGLTEQTIQHAVANDTASLTEQQRAALALADVLMTEPASLPRELAADLHRLFTPEQLIEITLDVMKWNGQKVPVALRTDDWIKEGELSDLRFDDAGNPTFG